MSDPEYPLCKRGSPMAFIQMKSKQTHKPWGKCKFNPQDTSPHPPERLNSKWMIIGVVGMRWIFDTELSNTFDIGTTLEDTQISCNILMDKHTLHPTILLLSINLANKKHIYMYLKFIETLPKIFQCKNLSKTPPTVTDNLSGHATEVYTAMYTNDWKLHGTIWFHITSAGQTQKQLSLDGFRDINFWADKEQAQDEVNTKVGKCCKGSSGWCWVRMLAVQGKSSPEDLRCFLCHKFAFYHNSSVHCVMNFWVTYFTIKSVIK